MSVIENWWRDLIGPLLGILTIVLLVSLYLLNFIPEVPFTIIFLAAIVGIIVIIPVFLYSHLFKRKLSKILFISGSSLLALSLTGSVLFQIFPGKPIIQTMFTPETKVQIFNTNSVRNYLIFVYTNPLQQSFRTTTYALKISKGKEKRIVEGEFVHEKKNLKGKQMEVTKKSDVFILHFKDKKSPLKITVLSNLTKNDPDIMLKGFKYRCPKILLFIIAILGFVLNIAGFRLEGDNDMRFLIPHSSIFATSFVILVAGKLTPFEAVKTMFGYLIISGIIAGIVGELLYLMLKKRKTI